MAHYFFLIIIIIHQTLFILEKNQALKKNLQKMADVKN